MLKYANGLRKKELSLLPESDHIPDPFFNMTFILVILFTLIFLAELLKEKR